MSSFPVRFVADDRTHALALLIHKALPLKVKGELRRRLETMPDTRLLITVNADHSIDIAPHPLDVAPQPITSSPDQPAPSRRSKK